VKNLKYDVLIILKAIRAFKNFRSDAQLASELGTRQSTVATWRKRGNIPYPDLFMFSEREKLDYEALLCGEIKQKGTPISKRVKAVDTWVEVKKADGVKEKLEPVFVPASVQGAKTKTLVMVRVKNNDSAPVAEKGDLLIIDTSANQKKLVVGEKYVFKDGGSFILGVAENIAKVGIFIRPYNSTLEAVRAFDVELVGQLVKLERNF